MQDEFKLKNYSTSISGEKSIAEIEVLLAKFGASAIMKNYLQDGSVTDLAFKLDGKGYKLPANVEGVKKILTGGKRNYHATDSMKKRDEQAYKTAWRIIKDWLYAQLSIIKSGQAQPDQILLPFQFNGKQTFYEAYKNNQLSLKAADEVEIIGGEIIDEKDSRIPRQNSNSNTQ